MYLNIMLLQFFTISTIFHSFYRILVPILMILSTPLINPLLLSYLHLFLLLCSIFFFLPIMKITFGLMNGAISLPLVPFLLYSVFFSNISWFYSFSISPSFMQTSTISDLDAVIITVSFTYFILTYSSFCPFYTISFFKNNLIHSFFNYPQIYLSFFPHFYQNGFFSLFYIFHSYFLIHLCIYPYTNYITKIFTT